MGRVVGIYPRPSARTPVRAVEAARAVTGQGLEGDHAGGGNRQITLIEREKWEAACVDLGRTLNAGARRANLVVEGVALSEAIGGQLRVGNVLVDVISELRPCKLMDDAAPGLQEALSPDCRGDVYGKVLQGGLVTVGGAVEIVGSGEE